MKGTHKAYKNRRVLCASLRTILRFLIYTSTACDGIFENFF